MKWTTRERNRANRAATCWLIRQFLDAKAELVFVPAEQVASVQAQIGGIGFDAPDSTYSNKDSSGLCSFAALVRERFAHDPALFEMARIVQAADIKDKLDNHTVAQSLQLISHGFPLMTSNVKRLRNTQLSYRTRYLQRPVKSKTVQCDIHKGE